MNKRKALAALRKCVKYFEKNKVAIDNRRAAGPERKNNTCYHLAVIFSGSENLSLGWDSICEAMDLQTPKCQDKLLALLREYSGVRSPLSNGGDTAIGSPWKSPPVRVFKKIYDYYEYEKEDF